MKCLYNVKKCYIKHTWKHGRFYVVDYIKDNFCLTHLSLSNYNKQYVNTVLGIFKKVDIINDALRDKRCVIIESKDGYWL